jgi:hypothetical protein
MKAFSFLKSSFVRQLLTRLLLFFAIFSLFTYLTFIHPFSQIDANVSAQIQQLESADQILKSYNQILDQVKDPALIARGNPPTGKLYAQDIKKAAAKLQKIKLTQPVKINYFYAFGNSKQLINDYNMLANKKELKDEYLNIEAIYNKLNSFLVYHASIMEAVANVLDYDPVKDFASFDINSPDTQERLSRANNGLAKAAERIKKAAKADFDPSVIKLDNQIKFLQEERNYLVQSHDIKKWTNSVYEAQIKIQSNRSEFLRTNYFLLKEEIAKTEEIINNNKLNWQKVAEKL